MLFNQKRYWPVFGTINAPSSVTGTLTDTSLGTITIPGGLMLINGAVTIYCYWNVTNSANNKTLTVKFGSTTVYTETVSGSGNLQQSRWIRVSNRNSASSQAFQDSANSAGFGALTNGIGTGAEDSTANIVVDFRATLANTGETITLTAAIVEVNPHL